MCGAVPRVFAHYSLSVIHKSALDSTCGHQGWEGLWPRILLPFPPEPSPKSLSPAVVGSRSQTTSAGVRAEGTRWQRPCPSSHMAVQSTSYTIFSFAFGEKEGESLLLSWESPPQPLRPPTFRSPVLLVWFWFCQALSWLLWMYSWFWNSFCYLKLENGIFYQEDGFRPTIYFSIFSCCTRGL